jgi:hypothetical protein
MLAGLIFGSVVMLGVCCWHFLRGHNIEPLPQGGEAGADRHGACDAAPAGGGQPLREAVTSAQSMKIAAPFHALRAPFLARTCVNAITGPGCNLSHDAWKAE